MKTSSLRYIPLVSIGLFAAAAVGCAALANMNAVSASNPLGSGEALTWSKQPSGIPFEGQQACTVWPLESEIKVTGTDAQICIKGKVTRIADSAIDGSSTTTLHATSDGSTEGKGGLNGQFTNSVESHPHKVGTCVDKQRGALNVWVASYDGCVPNAGMNGKPVLTKESTYLSVGDARWKFPVAATTAPAAVPAPAASTSAADSSSSGPR